MIKNVQQVTKKSKGHSVELTSENLYKVRSSSGKRYYVRVSGETAACGCKWGKYNSNSACSHVIAAHTFIEAQSDRIIVAHASDVDVSKQRRRTIETQNGVTLVARRK